MKQHLVRKRDLNIGIINGDLSTHLSLLDDNHKEDLEIWSGTNTVPMIGQSIPLALVLHREIHPRDSLPVIELVSL
jgi:hypothetical protein